MDDFRRLMYGVLVAFLGVIIVWVSFVYISACGFSFACRQGQPLAERTPIPTLAAATLPAPSFLISSADTPTVAMASAEPGGDQVARPSNPGGPGDALNLTGDETSGAQIFQANCLPCHGQEGKQGVPSPGTDDGSVPILNPIDPTLLSSDDKTFAYNLDLFIQHGSTPAGPNPSIVMPAWGDEVALTQQQIADVIAYIISLNK